MGSRQLTGTDPRAELALVGMWVHKHSHTAGQDGAALAFPHSCSCLSFPGADRDLQGRGTAPGLGEVDNMQQGQR